MDELQSPDNMNMLVPGQELARPAPKHRHFFKGVPFDSNRSDLQDTVAGA